MKLFRDLRRFSPIYVGGTVVVHKAPAGRGLYSEDGAKLYAKG